MSSPKARTAITERDRRILADLAVSTVLRIDALVALGHFAGVSRARRRMAALEAAGLVRRTYVADGSPSARSVFAIAAAAADLVAVRPGLEREELLRQARRPLGRALIEHSVMVAEARIALVGRSPGSRFVAEPLARHEYEEDGRLRIFRPDGVVLVDGEPGLAAFLECDRGTVGSAKWRATVRGYRRYVRLGLFAEEYGGAKPAVLVVTTGSRRAASLAAAAEGPEAPAFWFARAKDLAEGGAEGRIWTRGAQEDTVSFADVAAGGGLP